MSDTLRANNIRKEYEELDIFVYGYVRGNYSVTSCITPYSHYGQPYARKTARKHKRILSEVLHLQSVVGGLNTLRWHRKHLKRVNVYTTNYGQLFDIYNNHMPKKEVMKRYKGNPTVKRIGILSHSLYVMAEKWDIKFHPFTDSTSRFCGDAKKMAKQLRDDSEFLPDTVYDEMICFRK